MEAPTLNRTVAKRALFRPMTMTPGHLQADVPLSCKGTEAGQRIEGIADPNEAGNEPCGNSSHCARRALE